jgi:hypothetical protein
MTKRPAKNPPRGLPSRWIASRTGLRAYVVETRERHPTTGEPCYRLRFRDGVTGDLWTRERLETAGVRWLTRRPPNFPL